MEQNKIMGGLEAQVDASSAEVTPDKYKVDPVNYSAAEIHYRAELIWKLELARNQRDRIHPELDNMTYIEYYESNRKKDLSFIPGKKNKSDVRIVTGTTREKDTTVLTALLNMNLESNITAFDVDDLVVNELGENIGDCVKKSSELEDWDKKRGIVYRELISQGDVFVQELWQQDYRPMPVEDVVWDPTKDGISDFTFHERIQKIFEGATRRMVNGKKVYLGNIRCEHVEDQDIVAILNILPRSIAGTRYQAWERWKNVPYTIDTTVAFNVDGKVYHDWNLVSLDDKERVAEIMIYEKSTNRFMIMLNGVMMVPINYPLTAISPTGEIPISQGKNEPISDFAYSKSQPSKTKIDQEVLDETLKLMIRKFRQTVEPPMGSRGKKVYAASIFTAGKFTNDVQEGELFPLLPSGSNGLTQPEFSFYNLIKQGIDDKTTDDKFSSQGDEGAQPLTATEIDAVKNAQMLKLGLVLDGVIHLERRMTWNRIYTILTHWTQKIDSKMSDIDQGIVDGYKQFSVNTTVDNGESGIKMFRQSTKPFPSVDDQEHEEDQLTKKHGKPVRIIHLNPEMLRTIKYRWFIVVNPTPKSSDKLSQLLFIQNLTQAINLFGPDSLNMDYIKQRFAVLTNENYGKYFKKMSVQDMLQQQQNQGGQGQQNSQGGQGQGGGAPQNGSIANAPKPMPMGNGRRAPMRAAMQ